MSYTKRCGLTFPVTRTKRWMKRSALALYSGGKHGTIVWRTAGMYMARGAWREGRTGSGVRP